MDCRTVCAGDAVGTTSRAKAEERMVWTTRPGGQEPISYSNATSVESNGRDSRVPGSELPCWARFDQCGVGRILASHRQEMSRRAGQVAIRHDMA